MRDSASVWYESTVASIANPDMLAKQTEAGTRLPWFARFPELADKCVWKNKHFFDGKVHTDRAFCEQMYNEWNDAVRAAVPAERLLVFEVKQACLPRVRELVCTARHTNGCSCA